MKRALLFVLPQALLIPTGFMVGLVWGFVSGAGGWAVAIANMNDGPSGPGPGHADAGLLVILVAVLGILLLAIASTLTMAGITAGLMGAMYGFVLSCLIDWLLLFRKPLEPRDIENVKRWAGRGALLISAFCLVILPLNPLRDVAGVWAVTGMLVCIGLGTFGVLRVSWARLKSKRSPAA
jgi:hypothetical protein